MNAKENPSKDLKFRKKTFLITEELLLFYPHKSTL